ncbi:hypothetical protein MGYG_07498 [Nannizzia gypsea CBS 118893]|uniref:Uncharacterized protein n=1 Tax=Arthroderma gypseum (strain ATCC MYA-4604 / CBS 118893) TaxID=535722 RepID=E4V3B6_ARTGP|nr:hypothetical protein MGYG_07498 [Nannizzia gypsea CBS 118893]EFR04490.1 hypothetical protein MGYG_07498 [Nannizzia gypsea CBS 118893]
MDERMAHNMEQSDAVAWSIDLTISPAHLITVILTVILLFRFLFGRITNFEELFDKIRIYWVSNKIRKAKELFQTDTQIQIQTDWIKKRELLDAELEVLRQRNYYLRETFIKHGMEDKLEDLDGLDNYGPSLWEDKLADSKMRLWLNRKARVEMDKTMPKGPRTRAWVVQSGRAKRKISKIGLARYLAQEEFVNPCKKNDGCCARKCGCCTKPRDVSSDGEVYFAHCTEHCLCCIGSRGFATLDTTTGSKIPGFVKLTHENTFPQQARAFLPETPVAQNLGEEEPAYQAEAHSVGEGFDESMNNETS